MIAPLDSLDDSVSGSKVTAAQRASIMTKLAEKAGMDVPAETLKARHVHVVVAVLLLLCCCCVGGCTSTVSRPYLGAASAGGADDGRRRRY